MRALELEVLVHPFRPTAPASPSFSLIPAAPAAAAATDSSATSMQAHVYGWRGEGRLGGEMGPVTLLSEVFVLNLKRYEIFK